MTFQFISDIVILLLECVKLREDNTSVISEVPCNGLMDNHVTSDAVIRFDAINAKNIVYHTS